jgi:C4-dicarboxylate-binding protein DctP
VQFKEEVEKEANNEVLIEIFDRGKLYNDDQVVDAVRSGAIEMGVAGFHQVSRMLPALDIMELPFLFNFEALVRAATSPDSELRQLIDPAILESTGMRVLWWQTIGPQIFFSKGEDVLDPARIKNKRIRVNSDTMATFTKHCGGTPVVLSVTQVHDALKNGTLDMAMISVTAAETRELWKVTDTITRTDHGLIEFLVTINEKSWQVVGQPEGDHGDGCQASGAGCPRPRFPDRGQGVRLRTRQGHESVRAHAGPCRRMARLRLGDHRQLHEQRR